MFSQFPENYLPADPISAHPLQAVAIDEDGRFLEYREVSTDICYMEDQMVSKLWVRGLMVSLIAGSAILALFTFVIFSGGSSAGGTLFTGRSVTAHSDSAFVSCTSSDDTATVKTVGRSIVVQPTALIVDGVTVGAIDEAVRTVEVTVKGQSITFVADGKVVPTKVR